MSSDGCRLRISYTTKAARTTMPATIQPSTPRLPQSRVSPPCTMPYTSMSRPTIEIGTPTGSMPRGVGSRVSGTRARMPATPRMTTGTLTRNTDPHQKCSRRKPPRIGPIAMAAPTAPAHRPTARPRSDDGKITVMMARVTGSTAAAPMPMSPRNTISWVGDAANADSADATPNSNSPMTRMRLRPYRSPRTPHVNSSAANTTM